MIFNTGIVVVQSELRIEKPVPAQWLGANEEVTLAAEIDKLWTPPQPGGARLGFVLVALGLEQLGLERLGSERQGLGRREPERK